MNWIYMSEELVQSNTLELRKCNTNKMKNY